jgi:DNA (cytosine-5)-methyltransferase 1
MLTYLAIANQYRPKWLVWENVPGVLSSNGGLDFASLLRGMGECGYGFAYRILDAQYFGVAQRRRRVFVVGCLGDWRSAAAVLFERYSLSGNIAPSREKGKSSSKYAQRGIAECSPTIGCELSKQVNNQMIGNAESFFIPEVQPSYGIPGNWIGRKPENGGNATEPMYDIAPCLTQADQHGVAQPIAYDMKQHHNPQPSNTIQITTKNCAMVRGDTPLIQPIPIDSMNHIGRGDKHSMGDFVPGAPCYTLTKGHSHAVAQPMAYTFSGGSNRGLHVNKVQVATCLDTHNAVGEFREQSQNAQTLVAQPMAFDLTQITSATNRSRVDPKLPARTILKRSDMHIASSMAVRRLLPVECERLQGFPDNYTNINQPQQGEY